MIHSLKKLNEETVFKLAEDELPWPPEDVVKNIVKTISDYRKQLSKEWIDDILAIEPDIPEMDVASANQLISYLVHQLMSLMPTLRSLRR